MNLRAGMNRVGGFRVRCITTLPTLHNVYFLLFQKSQEKICNPSEKMVADSLLLKNKMSVLSKIPVIVSSITLMICSSVGVMIPADINEAMPVTTIQAPLCKAVIASSDRSAYFGSDLINF